MDKFNEWTVSAFITPGSESMTAAGTALNVCADTKFILLHETKNEEGIRGFLHEVWELYLKVSSSSSLLRCLTWSRRC